MDLIIDREELIRGLSRVQENEQQQQQQQQQQQRGRLLLTVGAVRGCVTAEHRRKKN